MTWVQTTIKDETETVMLRGSKSPGGPVFH